MKVNFKKKVTSHICTIQWDRSLAHQCICWECNTFEDDFLKQCRFHYVFYAPNLCLPVINKLLIFIFTVGKRNFLKLFQILFWNLKSSRAHIQTFVLCIRSFSMESPISWKIIINLRFHSKNSDFTKWTRPNKITFEI